MDAAMAADGGAGLGSAGAGPTGGAGAGGRATSGVGGTGAGGAGAGGAGASGAGAGGAGAGAGGAGCGADCCPEDPSKTAPGACGCGVPDTDTDSDGIADCIDPAPHGWLRRLVFDHGQVGGTLTNFPLLVRIADAQLGASAAASGSDIHFLAADQSTGLDYEIETFDAASGTLVAWLRAPSLDATTDFVLYLGYGDGQPNRSNPSGVWSAHHYVWHLAQDPSAGSGAIKDSAARAHGSSQGAMTTANSVAAVAGKGISFDGVDDCISFTNDLTGNGPTTIQAWVNQSPQSSGLGSAVLGIGNQASNQARFLFSYELASGQTKVGLYGNDRTGVSLATGVWTQLVWTLDSGSSRLYVNGALVDGPATLNGVNTSGTAGRIGNSTFPSYNFFLLGQLDEVRVSTTALSTAWISTEYNSQKPGSTFLKTMDAPQPAP
jgi:MSHA biogenesis protein MshQ